jgi:hypothetical protein
MKLPAEGSTLLNSATVKPSMTTAIPAARIVNGAAIPAVTAITPEGEVEVDARPDVGDGRGGHIGRAELAGLEVLCAVAHRAHSTRAYGAPSATRSRGLGVRTTLGNSAVRTGNPILAYAAVVSEEAERLGVVADEQALRLRVVVEHHAVVLAPDP